MDDVTDIAVGLRAIEDPRALLEGLFAHAPVAFQVFRADGHCVLVNRAYVDMFGAALPAGYNVLADAAAPLLGTSELVRRAFTGETVQMPAFWYDPARLGDAAVQRGRRIAVSITFFPLRRGDGPLEHVALCFRDETAGMLAREEAEAEAQKLRESEASLATAQRMAQLGSWELELGDLADRDRNPLRWSDEVFRIFGHEPGAVEVSNAAFFAAVHPDDRQRIADAVGRAIEHGASYELDHRVLRPDGSERIVHERAALVRDPTSGRPRRMVGTVHDVTEQRRAEALRRHSDELEAQNRRIEEASRLKSEFLANMSHELRTPLNAIIGFAELLHDGDIDPASPQYREFAGDIVASGRHLLQLINDVLDLSKVEAGKMAFHPTPVSLPQVVGEVCAVLRTIAAGKRIAVELDVDPAIDEATIDPARLKQILYNYLSNALKFTAEGGRVMVRIRPEATDAFRLEVEDSGIGIAAADVDGLFLEFHQLDNPLTKRHAGTGLGLALTRRLAEAQGGWVGVQTRLGEGSTFHAVLPLDARRPDPARAAAGRAQRTIPLERARFSPEAPGAVLIVDDDEPAARLMAALLAQLGHAAIWRGDAASGLVAAAELRPIAVVLDLLMPDVDGFAFLDRLRRQPGNEHTPVLVWTIKDLTPAERARLDRAARGVVVKGGASETLLQALREMLPGAPA